MEIWPDGWLSEANIAFVCIYIHIYLLFFLVFLSIVFYCFYRSIKFHCLFYGIALSLVSAERVFFLEVWFGGLVATCCCESSRCTISFMYICVYTISTIAWFCSSTDQTSFRLAFSMTPTDQTCFLRCSGPTSSGTSSGAPGERSKFVQRAAASCRIYFQW